MNSNLYFTGIQTINNVFSSNTINQSAYSLAAKTFSCDTFEKVGTMKDFLPIKGTLTQVLGSDGLGNFRWVTNGGGGGITSVNGTTNQISSNTVGNVVTLSIPTPLNIIDINATGNIGSTNNISASGNIIGKNGLISGSGATEYTLPITQGNPGDVITYGLTSQTSWTRLQTSPKLGNVIVVDQINGNDITGAIGGLPFQTIEGAISAVTSIGLVIWVLPGTYNLTSGITIPQGCSLHGLDASQCIIQMTGVTTNTTLITFSNNSRLENFTLNLTTNSNSVQIIGMLFPNSTSLNAKGRTLICNVTHTAATGFVYGILSNGIASTANNTVDCLRASTINVTSNNVIARGILVNAANRFSIRDVNIGVTGTTTNGVGVETTDPGAIANLHTSTIRGINYDIDRTAGNIIISYTDLYTQNANGNSFTLSNQPSNIIFGVIGNLGTNQTYFLVPGTITLGNLPSSEYPFSFSQNVILISVLLRFSGSIAAGVTITMNIYKNLNVTPSISTQLTSVSGGLVINNSQSVVITPTDSIHVTLVTVGNPGSGIFTADIGIY